MGTFVWSSTSSSPFLLLSPSSPSSPSSSSSSSSSVLGISGSSCRGDRNLKSSGVVVRRRSWRTWRSWSTVSDDSQGRTRTRWGEVLPVSRFAAESSGDDDNRAPQSITPPIAKTVFWNGVSNTRIAGLAAALLASTVCGNALAAAETAVETAVETTTGASDENSNFMFLVVCIGEAIALTGAAVGGVLARQRKVELEKINAQLRQINVNLRRQSRVESYAPNLTYAPVGSGRMPDSQVRSDPVREEMMQTLKTGKRWLREQNPVKAYGEFQTALALAQQLKDPAEEKKAARGLGASCQRQGKYKEAIKHHLLVLKISKITGERSGDTEAYGAIADCYTELGDLETAGIYYDRYIERLETDDTT